MQINFGIIIPTYNRPDRLAKALESLGSQTYTQFEVVVVDDCSTTPYDTDSSRYPFPLKILKNNTNLGPAGSRNTGVASTSSQVNWIVFLDDDDTFDDRKLEILSQFIANHKESPDLVHHLAEIKMINENVSYITSNVTATDYARSMLVGNVIGGTPIVAIHKGTFQELGGFDAALPALEDYELWLRAALASKKIVFLNRVLSYCNTYTKESSVSKNLRHNFGALDQIRQKHRLHYEQLSSSDLKKYEIWVENFRAHTYLLNRNRTAAFFYFKCFLKGGGITTLVLSLLSLVDSKLIFRARAKYGK